MKLAIIVPTLEESEGIAETLKALSALRQRGCPVIVADGGSSDDTCARARGLADEVLTTPRGRARQMNAGARAALARGADALLFLHADTRLPEGADHAIGQALDAGHPWGRFDVRIEGRSMWFALIARLMNLRSRLSRIATGDQGLFMSRQAWEGVGGFPDQALMEDIEICSRLRRMGRPACLRLRVCTSGRRWEKHGVWRTMALMWRLRWLYWRGVSAERLAALYAPHRSP